MSFHLISFSMRFFSSSASSSSVSFVDWETDECFERTYARDCLMDKHGTMWLRTGQKWRVFFLSFSFGFSSSRWPIKRASFASSFFVIYIYDTAVASEIGHRFVVIFSFFFIFYVSFWFCLFFFARRRHLQRRTQLWLTLMSFDRVWKLIF